MNSDYDACRSLYRAARLEEYPTDTERRLVRLALATAIATSVQLATSATSAASAVSVVAATGNLSAALGAGAQASAVGVPAVGANGILQLLLGGKFLSGLLCGALLGSAVVTTAVVVRPAGQSVGITRPGEVSHSLAHVRVQSQPPAAKSDDQTQPWLAVISPAPPTEAESPSGHSRVVPLNSATPLQIRPQLAEETESLAKVQDALSRQDALQALELISQQKRQFASGQLSEERSAAEVIALCAAGRHAEAEEARQRFAATYPDSPLTKRVNMGCGHH